jgi:hypothetical protein
MKRATVAAAVLVGYAWVSAGVAPFSTISYLLAAIPCVATVAAYVAMGGLSPDRLDVRAYYQRRAGGASHSTIAPWITVLTAVVILEAVGLLLGGRSPSVPTLSTTVDHLLATRLERCVMCSSWLLAGGIPLIRLRHFLQVGDS